MRVRTGPLRPDRGRASLLPLGVPTPRHRSRSPRVAADRSFVLT
ncbi:hypothetical protein ABZ397_25890 [Streptomyces sp. NPDC005876]